MSRAEELMKRLEKACSADARATEQLEALKAKVDEAMVSSTAARQALREAEHSILLEAKQAAGGKDREMGIHDGDDVRESAPGLSIKVEMPRSHDPDVKALVGRIVDDVCCAITDRLQLRAGGDQDEKPIS